MALADPVPLPSRLRRLNPAQEEAADLPVGPSLILSGAGTGKTTVLAERINRLIARGADARRIMAVVFTCKNAADLRTRIGEACGRGAAACLSIGTFNSRALRQLVRRPGVAGLTEGFDIYGKDEARACLRDVLLREAGDPDHGPMLQGLVPALADPEDAEEIGRIVHLLGGSIERFKNAALDPNAALAAVKAERASENKPAPERIAAAILYGRYQDALRKRNAADLTDQLLWPTLAMKADDALRIAWAGEFDHLLVDEYQDTNDVQFQWLFQLVSTHRSLWAVGDDNQSLYRFRGSRPEYILRFETYFPDARVVTLSQNYRCSGRIIAAANAVIKHNRVRREKSLAATREDGAKIRVIAVADQWQEAAVIAAAIKERMDAQPSERFFILPRANWQMRALEHELLEHGIAYEVAGGKSFYQRAEIQDALAWLALADRRAAVDADAFRRVINLPARSIGAAAQARILARAELDGAGWLAAARALGRHGELRPKARDAIEALAAAVDAFHSSDPLDERFAALLSAAELARHWQAQDPASLTERMENIEELIRMAAACDAKQVLERARRVAAAVARDSDRRVTLLTLHGAKGLEEDSVFLPGWAEGLFPPKKVLDEGNEAALEEERRLAYVGLTRARDRVVITVPESIGRRSAKPSRFVGEIPSALRQHERGRAAPARPESVDPGPPLQRPAVALPPRETTADELPADEGFAQIAQGIHASIEIGEADDEWQFPWHSMSRLPSNPFSARAFRSTNLILCWAFIRKRKLTGHFFASPEAWEKRGGRIKPGATGVRLMQPVLDPDRKRAYSAKLGPKGGDPTDPRGDAIVGWRKRWVLHESEVEGARFPPAKDAGSHTPANPVASVRRLIEAYLDAPASGDRPAGPALVRGGASAHYSIKYDRITMPLLESFVSAEHEAATILHETAHSTSSPGRLNRPMRAHLRSRSREELCAELTSAFLGAELGLPTYLRKDHAIYVRSWLEAIRSDHRAFWWAARQAERASDYLKSYLPAPAGS